MCNVINNLILASELRNYDARGLKLCLVFGKFCLAVLSTMATRRREM